MSLHEFLDDDGSLPEGVNLPIETADDAALRQLAGAAFLKNLDLQLTLPSGITIGSDEAQAFTSLLEDDQTDK